MNQGILFIIGFVIFIIIPCIDGRKEKQKTKYYEEKMYEHAAKGEFEAAEAYSRIVVGRKRNKM